MGKWSSESAKTELQQLIRDLNSRSGMGPGSAAHVRWQMSTARFLEEVFGPSSNYFSGFVRLQWRHVGARIVTIDDIDSTDMGQSRFDTAAYKKTKQVAEGILLAALDALERNSIDQVYEGKNSATEASALIQIVTLMERKLRKTIREAPANEKSVQDSIENLLIGADIPYKREFPAITYATKQYRPDFSFSQQKLVLEVKICNRESREKEMIAEINDDILAYRSEFPNLLFVIYDLGMIRDIDAFSSEFEANSGVLVRVVKH